MFTPNHYPQLFVTLVVKRSYFKWRAAAINDCGSQPLVLGGLALVVAGYSKRYMRGEVQLGTYLQGSFLCKSPTIWG